MAPARENTSLPGLGTLWVKSYSIDGNDIRAYYDAAGKLVFVIDNTIAADKPNALLVINPVGDRKWDDILSNDYGVVLEVIRPKKDNKYQKLDIEYSGLAEYDNLIQDYDAGRDLSAANAALAAFRVVALRRSAQVRRDAADALARTTRDTIAKTRETIAELTARLKMLRAKLSQQKKDVGKEPTKQSAAKILRTESQIDATNEKLRRARKRLNNAQRRLTVAEEDAAAARRILDAHADNAVSVPVFKDIMMSDTEDIDETEEVATDTLPAVAKNLLPEPKAKDMAEEVKPLFNKDPEILDEEIAFKPIDFGTISVPENVPSQADADAMPSHVEDVAPAPLSFVPPSAPAVVEDFVVAPVQPTETVRPAQPAPVLDSLTAMPETVPARASENYVATMPMADVERPRPVAPVLESDAISAAMRPASPAGGAPIKPVAALSDASVNRGKPTFLYYLMLIALIVLSIFTLWLYQKSTRDNVPDLESTVQASQDELSAGDSPFLSVEPEQVEIAEVVEEVVAPVVVPETPVVLPEPEPEVPVIVPDAPAIPVQVDDTPTLEDVAPETPFLSEPAPLPEPVKPVVVNKPAYNAGSQNENMFVAAPDYETESTTVVDMYDNPVSYNDATIVAPADTASAPMCEDGGPADANGCCAGEVFTDSEEGFVCCSEETGECFKPLF